VGGLINYSMTGYSKDAEACDGVQPPDGILVTRAPYFSPTPSSLKSSADSTRPNTQSAMRAAGVNVALIIGLSVLCTVFFVLVVVALKKRKSSQDEREYTTDSVESPVEETLSNNEAAATKNEIV